MDDGVKGLIAILVASFGPLQQQLASQLAKGTKEALSLATTHPRNCLLLESDFTFASSKIGSSMIVINGFVCLSFINQSLRFWKLCFRIIN